MYMDYGGSLKNNCRQTSNISRTTSSNLNHISHIKTNLQCVKNNSLKYVHQNVLGSVSRIWNYKLNLKVIREAKIKITNSNTYKYVKLNDVYLSQIFNFIVRRIIYWRLMITYYLTHWGRLMHVFSKLSPLCFRWRLVTCPDAKPLPKLIMAYRQLEPKENISMKTE